jgi:hypothetical protein
MVRQPKGNNRVQQQLGIVRTGAVQLKPPTDPYGVNPRPWNNMVLTGDITFSDQNVHVISNQFVRGGIEEQLGISFGTSPVEFMVKKIAVWAKTSKSNSSGADYAPDINLGVYDWRAVAGNAVVSTSLKLCLLQEDTGTIVKPASAGAKVCQPTVVAAEASTVIPLFGIRCDQPTTRNTDCTIYVHIAWRVPEIVLPSRYSEIPSGAARVGGGFVPLSLQESFIKTSS